MFPLCILDYQSVLLGVKSFSLFLSLAVVLLRHNSCGSSHFSQPAFSEWGEWPSGDSSLSPFAQLELGWWAGAALRHSGQVRGILPLFPVTLISWFSQDQTVLNCLAPEEKGGNRTTKEKSDSSGSCWWIAFRQSFKREAEILTWVSLQVTHINKAV